jgi:hypothetical protein
MGLPADLLVKPATTFGRQDKLFPDVFRPEAFEDRRPCLRRRRWLAADFAKGLNTLQHAHDLDGTPLTGATRSRYALRVESVCNGPQGRCGGFL